MNWFERICRMMPRGNPAVLRSNGFWLIVVGGVLVVAFVPLKLWMALIGAILVVIGVFQMNRC